MTAKKPIAVAVTNTKGGSTKSTSCINLAAAGAALGKKVLVIDFDQQGSATTMSGVRSMRDIDLSAHSSALIALHSTPPTSLAIKTEHGFDIVPADQQIYELDEFIKKRPYGESCILNAFGADADLAQYDLVLCDTQGAANQLVSAVLNACGEFIIPNLASEGAAEQLDLLLGLVEILNEGRKHLAGFEPVQLRGHFFNNSKPNTQIHAIQNELMTDKFGDLHFADCAIISTTEHEKAVMLGQPLVCYAPDHKATVAYKHLFKTVFKELF